MKRAEKRKKTERKREAFERNLRFADGFDAINEDIERLVNERFKQEKEKQAPQPKLYETQERFHLHRPIIKKRAAGHSLAPSPPPRSTIATTRPTVRSPPPEPRRTIPRLPLLHSHSPRQAITENLSIMRQTHQFFLGNLKGRAEQAVTDRSFFLTSSNY